MARTDNESSFFRNIMLLSNKLQLWGDGIIRDTTMKQFLLLILINGIDKANPTVKEIAEYTGTSRQNAKKILEQLELKGHVKLNRSETDSRALSIVLTESSNEFIVYNKKRFGEAISKLFSEISDIELSVSLQVINGLLSILETDEHHNE